MKKLITKEIAERLEANGRAVSNGGSTLDMRPVVRLFTPDAQVEWILVSSEPWGNDVRLFGWCDLGLGFGELGYVLLSEIYHVRGGLGLPVERDEYFCTKTTMREVAGLDD